MKRKKTALTSFAVIISSLMLLSGCGSSGTSSTASTAPTSAAATDAKAEATPTTAPNITLTLTKSGTKAASGEDFYQDILPKMIHEKFPNITLEVQTLPDDQYYTNVKTKLAAGEGPDIFVTFPRFAGPTNVINMAKAGYAADLSKLTILDNLSKGSLEDMSYNGKPYAIPTSVDFLGTYYNKDLFAKVGITEFPKDWESFLAACQKLKDAGITPIVMGDKDPWWIQFGMYQIAANTVYKDQKDFDIKVQAGQETLSNPNWVKAITMYKELYSKGYIVKNSLGIGSAQANQMFNDGKAAMSLDGTWDYKALTAKGAVDFQRGFYPLPANEKGQPVWQSAATSAGFSINAKSKNIEAAMQVINFWFDGKSDLFNTMEKTFPISNYKGVPLANDLYKDAYDLYQKSGNSIYFANQMWPNGVADEMQAKFAEIIGGKSTTPEEVANAMQAKFKQLWKP